LDDFFLLNTAFFVDAAFFFYAVFFVDAAFFGFVVCPNLKVSCVPEVFDFFDVFGFFVVVGSGAHSPANVC
jgi:hypothetical protein